MKTSSTIKQHPMGATSLLVVTAIALVFIAIITGLTALSVREARQALDTDLSNRALAAAESSARDAAVWVSQNPGQEYTDCANTSPASLGKYDIDTSADNQTSIVCRTVTINTTQVNQLIKKDDASQIYLYLPTGPGANTMRLEWGTLNQNVLPASYEAYTNLPAGSPAAIEVTAVYWSSSGTNPVASGQDPSTAVTTNATILLPSAANCASGGNYLCRVDLNLDTLVPGAVNKNIIVQLKARYSDAKVNAQFYRGSVNTSPVTVQQSRAVIDVTAKVGNLYRRIQAEKPLGNNSFVTDVLNSNASICKNMTVNADFSLNADNDCESN